jgi:taurine dioxygenase
MGIDIKPLSPACGAEISGLDLRQPFDAATVAEIRKAWHEHLVIVFRDQDLSDEDQVRFVDSLGKVGEYMRPTKLREADYHPAVMMITNIREDGKPIGAIPDGEMMFHTDTSYDANPHDGTSLFAMQVTKDGGHTLFSNQYMVYDALPDEIKSRLAGRDAMHVFEFGTTVKTKKNYDRATSPHHPHPVFRRHPATGRLAVYVCPLLTEEIIDFPEDEGGELLKTIYACQERKEFIFEHVWRKGDLVLWDNRCLMHARTDFPTDQTRQLRRVTLLKEHAA